MEARGPKAKTPLHLTHEKISSRCQGCECCGTRCGCQYRFPCFVDHTEEVICVLGSELWEGIATGSTAGDRRVCNESELNDGAGEEYPPKKTPVFQKFGGSENPLKNGIENKDAAILLAGITCRLTIDSNHERSESCSANFVESEQSRSGNYRRG